MLRTAVCDLLGIDHPVVLGGMASVTAPDLAVAVSEAGGLGGVGGSYADGARVREVADYNRARTDKPFAINLTIGLTMKERLQQDFEACMEFDVPVLITSYGNPTPIVHAAHEHGITVFHDVINLRHAKKAEAAGVDAIIGVSHGAGGHAGRVNPRGYHWSPGQMRMQIREGNAVMPGIRAEYLDDNDMEAVLAFLTVIGAVDADLPPPSAVERAAESAVVSNASDLAQPEPQVAPSSLSASRPLSVPSRRASAFRQRPERLRACLRCYTVFSPWRDPGHSAGRYQP